MQIQTIWKKDLNYHIDYDNKEEAFEYFKRYQFSYNEEKKYIVIDTGTYYTIHELIL